MAGGDRGGSPCDVTTYVPTGHAPHFDAADRLKDFRDTRMGDRDHIDETESQQRWGFTCPICRHWVSRSRREPSNLPKFFPFCSERCKLVDLGAWLDAEYRIPAKPDEESEPALEEPSPN